MKKILSLVMIIAMLATLTVFAISANASGTANITAQVRLTDPSTGIGTLKVTMKIENNPGINTLTLKLGYNADTLSISSITNGNVFDSAHGGSLFEVNQSNNPLTFLFEHSGSENIDANGNLAVITFNIIDEFGNFDLSFAVDSENTCAKSTEGGILHPVDVSTTASISNTVNTQHNYQGLPVVIKPTCETDGETTKVCNVCGNVISKIITPAPGHDMDYENGDILEEPTCTKAGLIVYYCMRDNCEHYEDVDIPALGHDFEKTTVNGKYVYTCKRQGCGFVKTEDISVDVDKPETKSDFDEENTQNNSVPTSPKTGDGFVVVLTVLATVSVVAVATVVVRKKHY